MANSLYELLEGATKVATTNAANVFGVEIAIVTNVGDPEKQGRVKVCFPRLPGLPEASWARVAQPAAGPGRGFYWIPEVDDEVLVMFECGQANRPYVVCCLWNGKDQPMQDAYDDDNSIRMIQTKFPDIRSCSRTRQARRRSRSPTSRGTAPHLRREGEEAVHRGEGGERRTARREEDGLSSAPGKRWVHYRKSRLRRPLDGELR